MPRLSNRKIAEYVAQQLLVNPSQVVINQVAAYLITTKRTRQALSVARVIESALLRHGIAIADISSAQKLDSDDRVAVIATIKQHISNVKQVYLRETINPSLLGGVAIKLPGQTLDASVYGRLQQLKTVTASEA